MGTVEGNGDEVGTGAAGVGVGKLGNRKRLGVAAVHVPKDGFPPSSTHK